MRIGHHCLVTSRSQDVSVAVSGAARERIPYFPEPRTRKNGLPRNAAERPAEAALDLLTSASLTNEVVRKINGGVLSRTRTPATPAIGGK